MQFVFGKHSAQDMVFPGPAARAPCRSIKATSTTATQRLAQSVQSHLSAHDEQYNAQRAYVAMKQGMRLEFRREGDELKKSNINMGSRAPPSPSQAPEPPVLPYEQIKQDLDKLPDESHTPHPFTIYDVFFWRDAPDWYHKTFLSAGFGLSFCTLKQYMNRCVRFPCRVLAHGAALHF